ncbi:hypothetical protein Cal7507_0970 [Calothrix sp. PCC 7507]|nr:hypothetical protein Cal7507_0970 [Calothrix sp. PCC 7507]
MGRGTAPINYRFSRKSMEAVPVRRMYVLQTLFELVLPVIKVIEYSAQKLLWTFTLRRFGFYPSIFPLVICYLSFVKSQE